MTENVSRYDMEPFENPYNLSLDKLNLKVKTDGIPQLVPALSEHWVEKRYFLHYEAPEIYNDDGSEIIGAKDRWIEIVTYITNDLKWLLSLPFYRFWSNIIYNPSILDTLVSFLQEAPPFYALESFPNVPKMQECHEELRRNVLVLFARLVTNKESQTEYMNSDYLGSLLYDNYIFTVPIIFDLCQLYGRENAKTIERILHSLFNLQPLYNDDLEKSVPCLVEALNNVERRFINNYSNKMVEVVPLSEKNNVVAQITLSILEDLIIYILDISSTISVLLRNYPLVAYAFYKEAFMKKIVSIYANTIPEMYKKLEELAYNDECMPKYMELKHRLDVTRVEFLYLYRVILYTPVEQILDKIQDATEEEIKDCIEDYFNTLETITIVEKEFIIDYNQLYPINSDFEILCRLCADVDTIKCDYILQIVHAVTDTPQTSVVNLRTKNARPSQEPVAGPSGIQNNRSVATSIDTNSATTKQPILRSSVELDSLVTKVKDILADCGEGFIEMCLKYYNYDSESVINAILEEKSLPPHLKEMDRKLPHIPPDPMEASAEVDSAIGMQRLNIYDNDEFDVMTHDSIDMSRVYTGKRKDKYQNINELLNDKTEVKKASNIYNRYNIIVDDYDDEYDDTYDSRDVHNTVTDSTEMDAKPFTTPRVLLPKEKNDFSSKSESETNDDNDQTYEENGRDNFVQNPEKIRERYEQQRQNTQRGRVYHNVVGKPKGQGQDKNVVDSRNQKTVHKSSQGNHNRRAGAQYKRRQGMVPS